MENDAEMHLKWEPKSIKNQKSDGKKHAKNNAEIWGRTKQFLHRFPRWLGSIFGGAGEGGKLKTANTGWLYSIWHARHPGGVRRMENDAKMHPKWEPKSVQNQKNAGKTASENWCRNLMPKKNQNFCERQIFTDFGLNFWPCRGVGGR